MTEKKWTCKPDSDGNWWAAADKVVKGVIEYTGPGIQPFKAFQMSAVDPEKRSFIGNASTVPGALSLIQEMELFR